MPEWWVIREWELNPVFLIAHVFWVIFSIVLHELAHGVAAIRSGDDTPRVTGHMTWNPLVHMGQTSLILFAIVGIAWGMMPINPDKFRRRYDQALVSFAGPAMNLALFVLCVLATAVVVVFRKQLQEPLGGNASMFFFLGGCFNLYLAAFNLLPVPPLDGSSILGNFVPAYRNLWRGPQAGIVALILFVVVLRLSGTYIMDAAAQATSFSVDGVLRMIGHK